MTTPAMSPGQLEIELQRVIQEVFLSLLGGEPAPANDGYVTRVPAAEQLACRVCIHGGFEGQVVVQATFGIAAQLAEHMFGDDLTGPATDRDAQDALREVANIVAGNLKPLFGEHNTLGLPEDLPSHLAAPSAGRLAEASAEHGHGTLDVRVYASL